MREYAVIQHSLLFIVAEQTCITQALVANYNLDICELNWTKYNMPLPDTEQLEMAGDKKKNFDVAKTLERVLKRARSDDRITGGVYECANMLEKDPDHVMLCLLPQTPASDCVSSIQQKLIEAYCLENDIPLVRVTSVDKLSEFIAGNEPKQVTLNDNPVTMPSVDCSCMLVGQPPKGFKNKHENKLMEIVWHNQVVDFPV